MPTFEFPTFILPDHLQKQKLSKQLKEMKHIPWSTCAMCLLAYIQILFKQK